jgi:hypothetical protein
MLQYFRTELILPHVNVLCAFRPTAAYPGWIPKPTSVAPTIRSSPK